MMIRLAFIVAVLSASLLHAAGAQTNKPTLAEALAVPGVRAVVGNGATWDAYVLADLANLPAYAKTTAVSITPTMGTCGTSPSVSGTNDEGIITVGSGVVTSCAMNFSMAMTAAVRCIVTPSAAVAIGVTATTTAMTVTLGATLGGGKIAYRCSF